MPASTSGRRVGPGEGLDELDEPVALVDVDAGVAVGEWHAPPAYRERGAGPQDDSSRRSGPLVPWADHGRPPPSLLRIDAFRLALYVGLVLHRPPRPRRPLGPQGLGSCRWSPGIEHAAQDYAVTRLRGPRAAVGRRGDRGHRRAVDRGRGALALEPSPGWRRLVDGAGAGRRRGRGLRRRLGRRRRGGPAPRRGGAGGEGRSRQGAARPGDPPASRIRRARRRERSRGPARRRPDRAAGRRPRAGWQRRRRVHVPRPARRAAGVARRGRSSGCASSRPRRCRSPTPRDGSTRLRPTPEARRGPSDGASPACCPPDRRRPRRSPTAAASSPCSPTPTARSAATSPWPARAASPSRRWAWRLLAKAAGTGRGGRAGGAGGGGAGARVAAVRVGPWTVARPTAGRSVPLAYYGGFRDFPTLSATDVMAGGLPAGAAAREDRDRGRHRRRAPGTSGSRPSTTSRRASSPTPPSSRTCCTAQLLRSGRSRWCWPRCWPWRPPPSGWPASSPGSARVAAAPALRAGPGALGGPWRCCALRPLQPGARRDRRCRSSRCSACSSPPPPTGSSPRSGRSARRARPSAASSPRPSSTRCWRARGRSQLGGEKRELTVLFSRHPRLHHHLGAARPARSCSSCSTST